jgi:hypothetical protein
LFHRPFFGHYVLHLLSPLVVLGAIGLVDFVGLIRTGQLLRVERWAAAAAVVLMCALWSWQRTGYVMASSRGALVIDSSPIVEGLKSLHESGYCAFAISPKWTFAAGMLQTPPELTILSLKRGWAGQMSPGLTAELVASNHVAGIVVSPKAVKTPEWATLLEGYAPVAQWDLVVLYVRKDLNPKSIDLETETTTQMLKSIGL